MALRTLLIRGALAVVSLTPGLILAISPSTTTLTVTPSGPVASKTVITLTALVTSGAAPVSPGLVVFCNASAAHCEDAAILGHAQLTAAGSASIKTRFGIGSHSIRAVFQGTTLIAGSPSPVQNLSVTAAGNNASVAVTTIAPAAQGFTLTGTVTGFGQPVPTGTVSFRNQTNGNALPGSMPLGVPGSYALTQSHKMQIGLAPWSMVVADLNNDGIPDMVIGDTANQGILIVLGKGDGTFTLKSTLANPDPESGLIVADVNNDGIPDVVAGTFIYNVLMVYLGNGDGTFTTGPLACVGVAHCVASGVATGDFNNDGIPDVVAVAAVQGSSTAGSVILQLGKGDGSFTSQPLIPIGQSIGVAVADLNSDGFQDLILFKGDATISVMLGNGNGTFRAESTVINSSSAISFAVGDLNGDGIPDIVLNETGTSMNPPNGALTVLLGKGDGTFIPLPPSPLPALPNRIVLADFDGDGKLDLAATDADASPGLFQHYVTIVLGNGDGTFAEPTTLAIASGSAPILAAAADFNGDGLPDLATEIFAGTPDAGALSVLLGGRTAFAQFQASSVNFPPGNNQIVSQYSGDAAYSAATSPPTPLYPNPANTPIFSPAPGIYQWTQSITLRDSTSGSSIFYTLDGTPPSASSTPYTLPIEVTWDTTIKAFAVAPGIGASAVGTGVYSIDRPMETPVFSPPGTTYPSPQTISLTVDPEYCAHAICAIYYTLNGTTPTTASTLYTRPISLTSVGTTTIQAFATSHHFVPSPVAFSTYTIQ